MTTTTVASNAGTPAVEPTIAGTAAGRATRNGAAVRPFASVTIGDGNAGATDTLTILISGGGTLTDGAGFHGLTAIGTSGAYQIAGTAADITRELDALVFLPPASRPGSTITTGFTLIDASSAGGRATDDVTTVVNTVPAATTVPGVTSTVVDGSGTQAVVGLGTLNFVGVQPLASDGIVLVDLKDGFVSHGGTLEATLSNIQGVQLGAAPSVVIGLAAGLDLIYGGSGPDSIYGAGGTDIIRGGTGATNVVGGSGNEIFYSGGGVDVMRGGTGDNFMQAGAAASSQDTFYGNGGNDFVYGGGGTTQLFGAGGTEVLTGGSGTTILVGAATADAQGRTGENILIGGTGSDVFQGGIGTNLMFEGSGSDVFFGTAGTDVIYGGSGTSHIHGGSGTTVVTMGAGNQTIEAGTGGTFVNETAATLTAGRSDRIDGFKAATATMPGTQIYLPTADAGTTQFQAVDGGTAILAQATAGAAGLAHLFVANTSVTLVQAQTHFTL